jgi:hypothetical protein
VPRQGRYALSRSSSSPDALIASVRVGDGKVLKEMPRFP